MFRELRDFIDAVLPTLMEEHVSFYGGIY